MTPAMRQDQAVLPQLRDDFRLIAGAPAADGSPTWVLIDPAGEELHAVALETDVRWQKSGSDSDSRK